MKFTTIIFCLTAIAMMVLANPIVPNEVAATPTNPLIAKAEETCLPAWGRCKLNRDCCSCYCAYSVLWGFVCGGNAWTSCPATDPPSITDAAKVAMDRMKAPAPTGAPLMYPPHHPNYNVTGTGISHPHHYNKTTATMPPPRIGGSYAGRVNGTSATMPHPHIGGSYHHQSNGVSTTTMAHPSATEEFPANSYYVFTTKPHYSSATENIAASSYYVIPTDV